MLGLILVAVGLVVSFGDRLPIHLGRLPGDIRIEGKNSSVLLSPHHLPAAQRGYLSGDVDSAPLSKVGQALSPADEVLSKLGA